MESMNMVFTNRNVFRDFYKTKYLLRSFVVYKQKINVHFKSLNHAMSQKARVVFSDRNYVYLVFSLLLFVLFLCVRITNVMSNVELEPIRFKASKNELCTCEAIILIYNIITIISFNII